jgi:ASC-1-like (ASCH) protein
VNLKKSISKNGFIFKATFTDDTPAGTECLVRYGYNPSWDFVKGCQLPCVPDSDRKDESASDGSKDAAERKQDEEEKAPKAAKSKKKSKTDKPRTLKDKKLTEVPDTGSTSAHQIAHTLSVTLSCQAQSTPTRASYATGACSWTVKSGFLVDIVEGRKTREGRPYDGKYTEVRVGDYRNFGCAFYWLVVRIANISVFDSLTEMLTSEACNWRKLMPREKSANDAKAKYLSYRGMDRYGDSKWVAFALEVLEYKLGHNALQYAVCTCAVRFASASLVSVRERLVSPHRLLCEECKATSMYL